METRIYLLCAKRRQKTLSIVVVMPDHNQRQDLAVIPAHSPASRLTTSTFSTTRNNSFLLFHFTTSNDLICGQVMEIALSPSMRRWSEQQAVITIITGSSARLTSHSFCISDQKMMRENRSFERGFQSKRRGYHHHAISMREGKNS